MGFPTKVQLINRKGSEQWYISFPSTIAQAMEFSRGETVEWIIEDKALLALRRLEAPAPVLKKLCRYPPSVPATLEAMRPRLRAATRRRTRANARDEFAALSRTPHCDRAAHHFRFAVSGLERHLPPLLSRPCPRARDLLRRPPWHRRPTARWRAVPCRPRRFTATPFRPPHSGRWLAARSARAPLPDQLRARPTLSPDLRRDAGNTGRIPSGTDCLS
jgi:hypothetical protein